MQNTFFKALSLVILSVFQWSCNSSESPNKGESVVLYSSVDATYTRSVIKAFEEKTGIGVELISDTEAAKSTGLMNRLIAEQKRPVADVFWSGDPIRSQRLVSLGVGESSEIKGAAWRFRTFIFNTEKVTTQSEKPRSVFDLAKPEFAPHSCIANPQFGTTSMHFAVLYETYGEAKVNAFLQQFSANGGKMVASNGEVRRRVSSGEFSYGLTDSDDYSVAVRDGKPVGFIIPEMKELGVLAIPTIPVKIKNAPHSEIADKLIEFLLSSKTEQIMAKSEAAHLPISKSVEAPLVFKDKLKDVPWMKYDIEKVSTRLELMSKAIDSWVSQQ